MKKISVALIEFDYHAEVLRNSLHILSQPALIVHVFTSEKIWRQVNWQDENYFELSLQKKDESMQAFLNHHLHEINACDLALLNTVASHFKKWSDLKLTVPMLLRIHNSNTFFNSITQTYRPKWTPFYLWKDGSHLIRKTIGEMDWYYRKKFTDRVDHHIFPSHQIAKHAVNSFNLEKDKVWTLPFGFWKNSKNYTRNTSEHFKVCIIGKVDQRNRDYKTVLDAIELILPFLHKSKKSLELILLGKANSNYAKRMVGKFKKLSSSSFSLTSYPDFVPQQEFDEQVSTCDFFIIPTKIETRYTIYTEHYGYTKISGSINDVIKHHKPALITKKYPVDDEMKALFGGYSDSKELAQLLQDWMTSKDFDKIDFSQTLANYNLTAVQQQYLGVFKKILS